MKTKTGGIIATIATSLICGLPGVILACMGLIAAVSGQSPENLAQIGGTTESVILGAVLFLCIGGILVFIPILVGFITLRRKSTTVPIAQTSNNPSPVVQTQMPAPRAEKPAPEAPTISATPVQHPPEPSVSDSQTRDLYARLMALNRPTAPYQIIDGKSENVDLIAEWRIVDAQWYEVFAKANLTKVFRIYMKLDPEKREVRAMDKELTVSWKAGVPSFSAEASFFKGQKSSVSFGLGYAFTEELAPGQVYKYKFSTNELKKPIQDTIAAAGWNYKGVAFGKL